MLEYKNLIHLMQNYSVQFNASSTEAALQWDMTSTPYLYKHMHKKT